MTRLAILGAGGHAADVLSVAEVVLPPATSVILGDDGEGRTHSFRSQPLEVMRIEEALRTADEFVVAVGYPAPRMQLVSKATRVGKSPASPLVHPSVERHGSVDIGLGSVVMGLTWLSPAVTVGDHAYLGYSVKIGHDTRIGRAASVMPGAFVAGDAWIGDGALVGANAAVLQGVRIGNGSIVGAGAVVTKSVPDGCTAVGAPAQLVETRG